jgi:1-acyl-sn-glycerol-3-phosphate acyltransferase
VLRTGLGFAVFGLFAVLLGFVVIPAASALDRNPVRRQLRAQRILHWSARPYLALLRVLGVFRVVGRDLERLHGAKPILVVANHPTLLDIVVLVSLMPQADCIVNVDRADNAFLSQLTSRCGHIANNGGRSLLEECCRRLHAGRSLIVFPEGTRSPRGELGFLHRGAANIALASGIDPTPVVLRCDPPRLGKGEKWYDVPDRPMLFTITVAETVDTAAIRDSGVARPIAARRLTAQLREIMLKGLDLADV